MVREQGLALLIVFFDADLPEGWLVFMIFYDWNSLCSFFLDSDCSD